mgnify:FL=1|jgi:hypothetical protein
MTTSKTNPQVADGTLPPVVGQFISSECLGNFYVNSPSGDIIAMTPRRKLAQAIADAMNRSKGRTAKLLRCGWTVGRDDMLYPPTPGLTRGRRNDKSPRAMNHAAQELGRLGGRKTSEAKAAAARENGKRGGRPKKKTNPAAQQRFPR